MSTLPEILQAEFDDQWGDLCRAGEEAGLTPADMARIRADAVRVLPCSRFVFRSLVNEPPLMADLLSSGDLEQPCDANHLRRRLDDRLSGVDREEELAKVLRRFRRREMVRIAWRDLSGRADLTETMGDLSALADAVLDAALTFLYRRQCAKMGAPVGPSGVPQELVVVAMGKLGARELNFSSDIDLIFAYPESGEASGAAGTPGNDEWFTRLCRSLVRIIGESTADGFVFRVDVRLRPDGENGPLVMNFDNMERYYQEQGREWERYAWIKARPAAGDISSGRRLLERLTPFVYRRYLDFSTFGALRRMKQNIHREVLRRGLENDIKLGAGGIREIEFFGQIFQLVRGGILPKLRARRIETVLNVLADEGLVPKETAQAMHGAYRFFRRVEHRLQEFGDQQNHRLPVDPDGRARLAYSAGFDSWKAFSEVLDSHRQTVHRCFGDLLSPEGEKKGKDGGRRAADELAALWRGDAEPDECRRTLVESGYGRPEEVMRLIEGFKVLSDTRRLSREGRERLDSLMPEVLMASAQAASPEQVLSRLFDLVQAVQRRTTYLALLLEHPSVLSHLARLAEASPWISAYLARHPALLDELLDPRTLYAPPARAELEDALAARMDRVDDRDLEYAMEELCLFKQVNTLRVAAADITGVLPLMQVSDRLSDIAEIVLNQVLDLCWRHLTEKHGRPVCRLNGAGCERGFAVVAYGKLGGLELGYGSDLDLVFLHAGTGEPTRGGKKPVDDATFFARLGQRVLHVLTAHTPAGFLYPVDMRLRPSGTSGLLVSPVAAFARYQQEDAWTWEHQALVRARVIGGDPKIADAFEHCRKSVLAARRDPEHLKEEVTAMRERIRKEKTSARSPDFDLKQGPGGLVDIEFLVQFLVLCHAHRHLRLLQWTDNVRLIRTLARVGVLKDDEAAFVRKAYLTYRSKMHRLDLQQQPGRVPADQYLPLRRGVADLWSKFLARS